MINAYVNGEMMELLAGVEASDSLSANSDVTIEFIDNAPLTAVITYKDGTAEISIYVRDELHTNRSVEMHGLSNVSLQVIKCACHEMPIITAFAAWHTRLPNHSISAVNHMTLQCV